MTDDTQDTCRQSPDEMLRMFVSDLKTADRVVIQRRNAIHNFDASYYPNPELIADLIEAQAAEIEKLRGLLSDALDAIDYAGDELALWLEAAVALEGAGFEMGETEHAVSFAIGAAKKIRAALNKKGPGD